MRRNINWLWGAVLFLGACMNNDPKIKNTGPVAEQVRVPGSYELYHSNLSKQEFEAGSKTFPVKIFTTINVSCATCILKFDKWTQFQKEAGSCTKFLLVPICVSKDKFELIKYLVENNKVGDVAYPLLLDSTRAFASLNKQLADEMSGLAILTNANNEVLLKGNPIENDEDKKKFLEKICSFKAP